MPPQAQILWNGGLGPYDQLEISTLVTISNNDAGGESSWVFSILKQPLGSVATLVGAGNSRTLTPDVHGTYIVQVVVNGSLTDVSSGAVLYFPSDIRQPAPLETTEWNGSPGWAGALTELFERANHGVGLKPIASATEWGRIWHTPGNDPVPGPGTDDLFEACLRDAVGTYTWVPLNTTPRLGTVIKTFADTGVPLTIAEVDNTIIHVDSSGGPVVLPLPTGAAAIDGINFLIKHDGTNGVTLTPTGAGVTIDGFANLVLSIHNQGRKLAYVQGILRWDVF